MAKKKVVQQKISRKKRLILTLIVSSIYIFGYLFFYVSGIQTVDQAMSKADQLYYDGRHNEYKATFKEAKLLDESRLKRRNKVDRVSSMYEGRSLEYTNTYESLYTIRIYSDKLFPVASSEIERILQENQINYRSRYENMDAQRRRYLLIIVPDEDIANTIKDLIVEANLRSVDKVVIGYYEKPYGL